MKSNAIMTSVSCLAASAIIASSSILSAAELGGNRGIYTEESVISYPYGAEVNYNGDASGEGDAFTINWHKILGWGTLGMALITLGSGHVVARSGHCPLAGATTGLAIATCVTGFYRYGGVISFSDGDLRYNTHAVMGTAATLGFIAAIALAGGDGGAAHVHVGAASSAAFAVTLGVLYF